MRYRRSPARFFAPLALIASAFAVYTLAQPETDSGSASTSTVSTQAATASRKGASKGLLHAKTYVVKKNDTLSGIAQKTGLTIVHIQRLNTNLDVNTLRVGRRLTLRE